MAKNKKQTATKPETMSAAVNNSAMARTTGSYLMQSPVEGYEVERLTLPPIIKPSELSGPEIRICGVIDRIAASPVSTYKSELIVMHVPNETGKQFCFPATAVVAKALRSRFGVEVTPENSEKFAGKTIMIVGGGEKKSVTAEGKEKTTRLFEVFILTPKE